MRRLLRLIGFGLVAFLLLAGALWAFGPREPVDLDFTAPDLALDGLEAHFATAEARFDDITPGTEKRVIWAGDAATQTPLALVYIHGFSATSEEIRPVPDLLAQELGANLIYTRLQGHGRGGAAMAEATVAGWTRDVTEAIRAAELAGERVVILSTSTGGTLAAAAAFEPDLMRNVAGMIFVSPNFGLNDPRAGLITLPASRYWLPRLVGEEYAYTPDDPRVAQFWTVRYPSVAVLPMAALVSEVVARDFTQIDMPAIFWFHPDDQVVQAGITAQIAAAWDQSTVITPDLTPTDDPLRHVILGEIYSPGQTEAAVTTLRAWVEGLR